MTGESRGDPSAIYTRQDEGVDPPSIAFALGVERHMAQGEVVQFVHDATDTAPLFELHRTGGAFRIGDQVRPPQGTFASAQAAIAAGWAMIDSAARSAARLPPLGSLVDDDDPHGGA